MTQPVFLSDDLMADARLVAETKHCSIDSQIEHWVRLGLKVERALNGGQLVREPPGHVLLSEIIATINQSEGRLRLQTYLDSTPFPHFRPVPGYRDRVERIDENGSRVIGKIIGRKFVPID